VRAAARRRENVQALREKSKSKTPPFSTQTAEKDGAPKIVLEKARESNKAWPTRLKNLKSAAERRNRKLSVERMPG
jgi:hypothetical protein